MKTSNIFACAVSAAIVIVGIAAIADAAKQYGRGYNECQRHARSLGWNPNDEEDQGGFNRYVADCQRGEPGERAVSRSERAMARKSPHQNDSARRALARAEPKYQKYEVYGLDYCRDRAVLMAWNPRDEEDASQAAKYIRDCMRGNIPR